LIEERKLTLYDFLGAIMLGIAIVYFWSMMANFFPGFFQESSFQVVTIITIIVYLLGGVLISILVMMRTGGKSLRRGMIVGSITAIGTCVYISLLPEATVLFFAVVYFSYSLGGYLGALIWLKKTKPLTPSIEDHL
jgi:hypothetical protein